MKNRLISIVFSVALFLFILTFSIGLPIYCRPFYYAHVDELVSENSKFTREEIIDAYDEVLDYLTLPGHDFGTGVMKHSEEGAAHFADCKVLFDLNATVLILSSVTLAVILVLKKLGYVGALRLGKRSAGFWSAICAIVLPIVLGWLASLNFDRAFTVFHTIFFPGKDNWIFNPRTDEIITVLPQDFFMHCAILIAVGVILLSSAIFIVEAFMANACGRRTGGRFFEKKLRKKLF